MNPERPKLLLAEFHHLGDAVLAWPFLRAVRGTWEVQVWCRPSVAEIFRMVLPREAIRTWSPPWHEESEVGSRLDQLRRLAEVAGWWRAERFSVAVSVWADPRLQLLWTLAGIPRRVGLPATLANTYAAAVPERQRQLRWARRLQKVCEVVLGQPLLTEVVERNDERRHQLDIWQELAGKLGGAFSREAPWVSADRSLPLPVAMERAKAEGKKIFLAHVGGRLPSKRWSLRAFGEVLRAFRQERPGWAIVSVSGPGEPGLELAGTGTHLLGPSRLPEVLRWIEAADFILSNDSLPAHLAYALGRPGLAVFGSGDPQWFAPGGELERVIEAPVCPYRPCLDRCRQPSLLCLESLTPGMVLLRLLAATDA